MPPADTEPALERAGSVSAGGTVVVTGAGGAVGGAVTAIAAWRGAIVIGVVRGDSAGRRALASGASAIVRSDRGDVAAQVLEHTAGADLAIDTVGGPIAAEVLSTLAAGGGMCVLSAPPGDANAQIDTLDFYRKDLHLAGLNVGRLGALPAAEALAGLTEGFASDALPPVAIASRHDLSEPSSAYALGGGPGKAVFTTR